MSTTAPAQLDASQAYAFLQHGVSHQAFFNKLAHDYNIVPQTLEEAAKMLKIAGKLRVLYEAEQVKQAAAGENFLDRIDMHLDGHLVKAGQALPVLDQQIKQAAFNLQTDPQVVAAVLTLQAHAMESERARNAAA